MHQSSLLVPSNVDRELRVAANVRFVGHPGNRHSVLDRFHFGGECRGVNFWLEGEGETYYLRISRFEKETYLE